MFRPVFWTQVSMMLTNTSLTNADMNFQIHTLSWKRSVFLLCTETCSYQLESFFNDGLFAKIYRWIDEKLMTRAHIFLQYGHQVSKIHIILIGGYIQAIVSKSYLFTNFNAQIHLKLTDWELTVRRRQDRTTYTLCKS